MNDKKAAEALYEFVKNHVIVTVDNMQEGSVLIEWEEGSVEGYDLNTAISKLKE